MSHGEPRREVAPLLAGDSQARDLQRGGGGLVAEGQILPHHLDVLQHLAQIARDGDLLDGVRQLATLDPEPDGAP